MAGSTVYLIPAPLADDGLDAIPAYVIESVKKNVKYFMLKTKEQPGDI